MFKKLKRKFTLIVFTILFFTYLILGFIVAPIVIKDQANNFIAENYEETLYIESIFFNPFKASLTLKNLTVSHSKQLSNDFDKKITIGQAYIDIELLPLLWKEIHIRDFSLDRSKINFAFYNDQKNIWTSKKATNKTPQNQKSNWIINFKTISLKEDSFEFKDFNYPKHVNIALGPISLEASDLKTSLNHDSIINDFRIVFANNGSLHLDGKIKLNPLSLKINLESKNVPLNIFSAYLSKKTILDILDGKISLKGIIQYQDGALKISGNSNISQFKIVSQENQENVISFDLLSVNNFIYEQKNNSFFIDTLEVRELDTFIHLLPSGKLSYYTLLKKDNPTIDKPIKEKAHPFLFELKNFSLKNSKLEFKDSQINPHFMANINSLNGTIGPFTVTEKINIDLEGKVEAQGIFKANGFYNRNKPSTDMKLKVNFRNIEMTTFTPYSGHFAGYKIQKGKLFLALDYTLSGNRILGKNNVRFDQLTLGDKVDSANATGLPIKFALALLKDRNGQIKFNLPVEGNPNAPKFSMGNLIKTALYNMLLNIINAPFDFVAGLVGAGPEIKDLHFEATSSLLKEDQIKKIDTIVSILNDRPEIELEIQARAKQSEFGKENISIDELNQLSITRANHVLELFVSKGINAEKIYILNPVIEESNLPEVSLTLKSK